MGKTVFVVVKMYQGIVDDVLAFTDKKRAEADLRAYIKKHVSQDDIKEYGPRAAIELSDVDGSIMHVTELIED